MNEVSSLELFLIEPSRTQRLVIVRLLQACGIRFITCLDNGSEALRLVNQRQPDLIVSSMYLPDMTGVELLHALRQSDSSYDMAFLLISSETNIRYLEPIRQGGAIAILPKPFSLQQLNAALAASLDYLTPQKGELEHLDIADLRVLLVDDSEFSRKYIQRVLNNIGIEQISWAEDGKQGLEIYHQYYFDLVITDFNMPELDGMQLAEAIRCDKRQMASVPILMVTCEQNLNRLAAVGKAGISAVLDKPFEPAVIKRLIMQLLD